MGRARRVRRTTGADVTDKFAPATPAEYARWVRRHLQQGGTVTHFYDYPMPGDSFLTALRPFTLGGECGVDARHILVPEGIDWELGEGLGHNTLHFDDGSLLGDWVPVYTDEVFHGLPGYDEGMAAARRASSELRARALQSARREPYSDLTRYAQGAPDLERAARTAPSASAGVSVVADKVRLLPSGMPLDLSPDEALALAENLRAAALGASRNSRNLED